MIQTPQQNNGEMAGLGSYFLSLVLCLVLGRQKRCVDLKVVRKMVADCQVVRKD